MQERVVVLEAISEHTSRRIRQLLPAAFDLDYMRQPAEQQMVDLITDADYAIVSQPAVSRYVLRHATRLKLLQKWGTGVDNIDLDAARELGICVARTSGSNAIAVAEFTLGLIIAACRCIASSHFDLRNGVWTGGGRLPIQTMTVSGRRIGIVGFGAVGQALARLLRGFNCNVFYSKRLRLDARLEDELGVKYLSLPEMLNASDVVTLNCPLTDQTRGLLNRDMLRMMKPNAVLINTARGGVVLEEDLVWALRSGLIAAAAVDVFEQEPVSPDNPLLAMSNVLVTPHIAASSSDSFEPGVRHMVDNIARVSRGEPLRPADLVLER